MEAVALVNSRATRVDDNRAFLVPLADMLNHSPVTQVDAYFDTERKGYVIQALVDIPEGAEIHFNYGMGKKLSKEQIDPKLRKWLEKTNKINSGM